MSEYVSYDAIPALDQNFFTKYIGNIKPIWVNYSANTNSIDILLF